MYHNSFNLTSADGYLGHFQSLAILNNIMNILLYILFLTGTNILSVGYSHEWTCWIKGHVYPKFYKHFQGDI